MALVEVCTVYFLMDRGTEEQMSGKDINMIKRKMRGNLFIRFLVSPYLNVIKRKEDKEYLGSSDSQKLKLYKNIHKGKRCFIIGNGPSLRAEDLDKLSDEITLCGNRIYEIFDKTKWRPTYFFCIDNDGMEEIVNAISNINVGKQFLALSARKYLPEEQEDVIFINHTNKRFVINRYNDKSSHISEDISLYFSCGYTVLFAALQFAIYTGVKEIYLLGVDFDYSHVTNRWGITRMDAGKQDYFDNHKHAGSTLNYESTLNAWKVAKEFCDAHGIIIKNATRGGKLEVFERVNFEQLF